MFPGFLPFSRASLFLDLTAAIMVAIVPIMVWSIYLVKYRKRYNLHKRIQLTLGGVLVTTVVLFELDMRLFGWRHLANPSRYYDTLLFPMLYLHILFAATTAVLWVYTITGALRRFPNPPGPDDYSRRHRFVARIAAIDLCLTAVSGWSFYVMAFVL